MTDSTLPGLVLPELADINTQQVSVTPELAALWLTRNQRNRVLSQPTVDQYASDMLAGNWNFTGQPIVFDATGKLIDGQHRLTAQVKAGTTMRWLVVTGVPTATRDFIDIGRPRTVANQLQIKGVTFSNAVAAVARLDLIYSGVGNPSKPAIRAHAEENIDRMQDAGHLGRSIAQVIHGSSAAYGVAAFRLTQIDPDAAGEFFDSFLTGADLSITSPILVARRVISARKGSAKGLNDTERIAFINYLFKTWNLWRTGKRIKTFAAPTGPVVPVVGRALKAVAS